ncbi:hypothetical protein ACFR9U_07485 [Halorientalis brevis]|uniref:PIN domain-containing protein n=1 Tax=Halorientalis brevis TaxID=1126241 RepID=A0ABD6C9S5_9EURY|nr:hypothetical protein [Halorientalis brevis]
MTRIYVDATALVGLGQVGELELLDAFEGTVVVPDAVRAEVTTDPSRTNLDRFLDEKPAVTETVETEWTDQAMSVLGAEAPTSDVRVVEGILEATDEGRDEPDAEPAAGLVSDDRRLRTVAEGFGATVTGTFGVVVRAATDDKYLTTSQAKRIVRRIDSHGLHLTGELREQAVGATD